MKKFMMIFALVMAFVGGVFGKDVIDEIKKQNDEKFVTTAIYQDEIFPEAAHKKMSDRYDNTIYLDIEDGVYATGEFKNGTLTYTVWTGNGAVGRVEFRKVYRKSDDQSKVYIRKNGFDNETVCYTGNLLRNVVITELKGIL